MQKILIICLMLLSTSFIAKAQQMNFDETVKYINDKISCCSGYTSDNITYTIKASLTGDIMWKDTRINLFDLVPIVKSTNTLLESNGIHLYNYIGSQSTIDIAFQISKTSQIFFQEFKVQADAERVYKAILHLRSLCTKKKDPFDN